MPRQVRREPRAGLHSLPQELLKHIVACVAANDEAVYDSGVPVAKQAFDE